MIPNTFALYFINVFIVRAALAWVEYCSETGDIITVAFKDCPAGILFESPQKIGPCLMPHEDNELRDHIADVCDSNLHFDSTTTTIQFVDVGKNDNLGPDENDKYDETTCKAEIKTGDKCTGQYISLNKGNCVGFGEIEDEEEDASYPEQIPEVQNQTLRLFQYLTKGIIDEDDDGPSHRLIKLVAQSFNIIRHYTNPQKTYSEALSRKIGIDSSTASTQRFLRDTFFTDIEKAFLFLVRESDLSRLRDIYKENFDFITNDLQACLTDSGTRVQPIYFGGESCSSYSKIRNIAQAKKGAKETGMISKPYRHNEYSFKWGLHDVLVDAAWGVFDFVHGLCYGTFNNGVNRHHMYQRAMESLFTKEIIFRWQNPVELEHDYYWDHILRDNTRMAVRNLDAAIQAAYLGSPFLHRLKRPWITRSPDDMNQDKEDGRLKRSVTPGSEVPNSASAVRRRRQLKRKQFSAVCLQTTTDKDSQLEELRKYCNRESTPKLASSDR